MAIPHYPADDTAKPQPDDTRYWSVTSIIGALDKPALVPWAARETALAAIRSEATWHAILDSDGEAEAVRWLTGARYRRPRGQRTATEIGSAFHAAAEEMAITGARPDVDDDVAPLLDQFCAWLDRFQPTYEAAEFAVYHPDYGYAGTCDGILVIDGVRFIFDYKTSTTPTDSKGQPKRPYPEVALQLAAYRHAPLAAVWRARRPVINRRRYYMLNAAERAAAIPVPDVDAGLAIIVTPEHCEAHPVRCDDEVFRSFLYVQEVARFLGDVASDVVGDPLIPPHRQVA